MTNHLVIFDGQMVNNGEVRITTANRAFRYADALFETMLWNNGHIRFLQDHHGRMTRGMSFLGMEKPSGFELEDWGRYAALLAEGAGFGKGRIRLQVFRKDGGLYWPTHKEVSWVMEMDSLDMKAGGKSAADR